MDFFSIIISLLCSGMCCLFFLFMFLFIVGFMVMRKRGKKVASTGDVRDAVKEGLDASRAFVRGSKTREELLREAELEDDD